MIFEKQNQENTHKHKAETGAKRAKFCQLTSGSLGPSKHYGKDQLVHFSSDLIKSSLVT